MKIRTGLHILIGLLVAAAIVFFASSLQAGSTSNMAEMIRVQRSMPILWMVDLCAAGIAGALWWHGIMLDHFQTYLGKQAQLYHDQMHEMVERASELEQANDNYTERIEQAESEIGRQRSETADQFAVFERSAEARRSSFETETRRLVDSSARLFQSQLDQNARQVEDINMALQFYRSEVRKLRHEVRELHNQTGLPAAFYRLPAEDNLDTHTPCAEQMEASRYLPEVERRMVQFDAGPDASETANTALDSPREAMDLTEAPVQANSSAAETKALVPGVAVQTAEELRLPHHGDEAGDRSPMDRHRDWKSHVERLFHEGEIVENLPAQALETMETIAGLPHSRPSLRIIENENDIPAVEDAANEESDQASTPPLKVTI